MRMTGYEIMQNQIRPDKSDQRLFTSSSEAYALVLVLIWLTITITVSNG